MKTILLAATAALLCTGCAHSSMSFHPIEERTMPSIVRLKLYSNSLLGQSGDESTRSSNINLDVFRARVMQSTTIRFVEQNEDAAVHISLGELEEKKTLWYFDHRFELQCSMRITEPKSGRIIYIVTSNLVGPDLYTLGQEMNRLFVLQVIPVLEGKAPPPVVSLR